MHNEPLTVEIADGGKRSNVSDVKLVASHHLEQAVGGRWPVIRGVNKIVLK